MAISAAKRLRIKLVREHKLNPELQRGYWQGINLCQKRTPTLIERTIRKNNKHKMKWNSADDQGCSIFYLKNNLMTISR